MVTPLGLPIESTLPDSNIPEYQLDSDTNHRTSSIVREITKVPSIFLYIRLTWFGKIDKPVNLSNKELQKRYPGRNQQQLQGIRES